MQSRKYSIPKKFKKPRKIKDRALDVGFNSKENKAVFYYNSNDDLQVKMVNSISNLNSLVGDYENLLHQDSRQQVVGEAQFKEMEEFIANGYYKIQNALFTSQKRIDELLEPLSDHKSYPGIPSNNKDTIDSVSRHLKNSLIDLQKVHTKQNMILGHFKDITGKFNSIANPKTTKDFGCQTDIETRESIFDPDIHPASTKVTEAKNEIVKDYMNEYKFKIFHLINNPLVVVDITSKNKLLEPFIYQEKKDIRDNSAYMYKIEGDLKTVNKKLEQIKIEVSKNNRKKAEESILPVSHLSVDSAQNEDLHSSMTSLPNIKSIPKHYNGFKSNESRTYALTSRKIVNNLAKDKDKFLDKLISNAEREKQGRNDPFLGPRPDRLHRRGDSLQFSDFRVKKSVIKGNIDSMKHFKRQKEVLPNISQIDKSVSSINLRPKYQRNQSVLRSLDRTIDNGKTALNIFNDPIISMKLTFPSFETIKPRLLKPFLELGSEEELRLRETFEKLNLYPEISQLIIDDLISKYCGVLDNADSYKSIVDICSTIFHYLDILYEIFVSYNIPYCTDINSMKKMSWPPFKRFCQDIGYEELGPYFFYISTIVDKTLSPDICGETLSEQQKWCLKRIEKSLHSEYQIKITFTNFIEALVRMSDHVCEIDQKLSDKIIGFIESATKDTQRSLVFSYKFYLFEKEFRVVIQKYTPVLLKIYHKELENRLINVDESEPGGRHCLMNFRILVSLLKKWQFCNEDIKETHNLTEEDLINENRENTPLIGDRDRKEPYSGTLRYSHIIELFYASLKHRNYLHLDRTLRNEGIGLSCFEFIDFVTFLGIYMWRVNEIYFDLEPYQALEKTFIKVKTSSIKYNIIQRSTPCSEFDSPYQNPTSKFPQEPPNLDPKPPKQDDFKQKTESSKSLFDRLKIQHQKKRNKLTD
ncbi:unnamed protein product [Moneuplotes crassus]|uniref:Uncharacterized protein n=1 Tax=Euplotes crassus TaxID=5936 RepID=A0AAD1XS84_EUPCR|nr:unnamed protein product [Moneuplotes crassus]